MRRLKWLKISPLVLATACYSVEYQPTDPTAPVVPEPTNDNEEVKQPRVEAFSVSATQVTEGDTIDIMYTVTDAETVAITTDKGTTILPSSTQLTGSAFTRPIMEDTVFIITATNKDK